MCEKLGYANLQMAIWEQATNQMLLAEWLIERISLREGSASSYPNKDVMDKTDSDLISKNESDELDAFRSFSNSIELSAIIKDNETAEALSKILRKEKDHSGRAQNKWVEVEHMRMRNLLLYQLENLAN